MVDTEEIPVGTLAVVALLVGAAVLLPAAPFSSDSPGKNGTVTNQSSATTVRDLPDNLSEQLYPVPDSHTETPSGNADTPPVSASAGSQTMQVSVREDDGVPQMVLNDSETHSGRWVSVSTDWIRQQAGDVPEMVSVRHSENGEYNAKLYTREGSSAFYVREFSSNTVTFSSEVSVTAAAATDGTTLTYNVGNLSDPSGYDIAATGVKSTEAESMSWTGVSSLTTDPQISGNAPPENVDVTFTGRAAESNSFWEGTTTSSSETATIDVGGTTEPKNETVTFTGQETSSANSWSAIGQSSGQSTSISVGGNVPPENAEVTFTGRETSSSASSSGTGSGTASVGGNLEPRNQQVTLTGDASTSSASSSGNGVDANSQHSITVDGNTDAQNVDLSVTGRQSQSSYNPVDDFGDGTAESGYTSFGDSDSDVGIGSGFLIEPTEGGNITEITINIDYVSADYNPEVDVYLVPERPDTDYTEGTLMASGVTIDASTGTQTLTMSSPQSVSAGQAYTLEMKTVASDNDADADIVNLATDETSSIPSDGYASKGTVVAESPDATLTVEKSGAKTLEATTSSGSTVIFGDVSNGETVSRSPNLSPSDDSITFESTSAGVIDYSLSYDEVTETADPSIDVDGDGTTDAAWSGLYGPGDTTTAKSVSSLSTGGNSVSTSTTAGPQPSWTISYDEITATEDPSVDVDGDGTADVSYTGILQSGGTTTQTLQNLPSGGVSVTTTTAAGITDWNISADEVTATEDPSLDIGDDGITDASHTGILLSGETATVEFDGLSTGSQTLGIDANNPGVGWQVEATTIAETTDPSLDIGDDGTTDASYSGTLSAGQSVTRSVSVSSIPSTVAIQTTGGSANVTLAFDEVTTTPAGDLTVNGNTPSTWTALSPGESTALATNTSWITADQNTVNISLDDSGLSTDAPAPKVDINYSHTASEPVSATVSDEKWSQRYVISKTWGANQTDAQVTVPLKNNVIDVRELTKSTNGGPYSAVNTTDYSLDTNESELVVQLGDVTAGENVTVRANMTKVQVQNATIEILQPTLSTNTLDSKIELSDWQETSYIAVDGTRNANHTVYTENESWSTVDSTYYVDGSGNRRLRMPNAGAGATTLVKSTPLKVTLPDGGEVALEVVSASDDEPQFRVEPGVNPGDTVRYELVNGRTDGTHALYGSDGDQLDSTDSQVLVYNDTADTFSIRFTTAAFASGGSGGGLLGSSSGSSVPLGAVPGTFVPLAGVALALAGLVVASRSEDEAVASAGDGAATATQSALRGIPVIGPAIAGAAAGTIRGGSQLAQAVVKNRTFGVALGGAIVVGTVQLGIVEIPEGSGIILIVAGVGIGSLVALREVEEFSTERWVGIVTAATVVAIQTQSDGSILTAIVDSQVFPVVAIGALYLAYRFVQSLQQPNSVTEVVVDGENGGDQ